MISVLSDIAKNRQQRGHKLEWSASCVSKRNRGQSRVVQSHGGSLSRSATARKERDNGQVLKSSWLEGNREVVNDVVVRQVNQQRPHSRT